MKLRNTPVRRLAGVGLALAAGMWGILDNIAAPRTDGPPAPLEKDNEAAAWRPHLKKQAEFPTTRSQLES